MGVIGRRLVDAAGDGDRERDNWAVSQSVVVAHGRALRLAE